MRPFEAQARQIVRFLLEDAADVARYDELVAQMRAALQRRDFNTFTRLQAEVEAIKRKTGGMPPK